MRPHTWLNRQQTQNAGNIKNVGMGAHLEQPPEKKHHQTKQKDINKMVMDNEYIRQYVENARTKSGNKRYAGYTYAHASVYYNDYNARFYIRVRMRKGSTENDEEKRKATG